MTAIPLCYPKIPRIRSAKQGGPAWAFHKIDGTNLHWVFDPDQGWTSFGTRRNRFDLTSEGIQAFHDYTGGRLPHAPGLFPRDLNPGMRVTVFTEYSHPESFNGEHPDYTEPSGFRLTLIDAETEGGFLYPDQFIEFASALGWPPFDIAPVLWKGSTKGATFGRFLDDLAQGRIPGVIEGVVLKGLWDPRRPGPWRAKVKTDAWESQLARRSK